MNAADIATALRTHYGCQHDNIGPEWAALDEMAMGPGGTPPIIDLLCIRAWKGRRGHERHAIEIKTSRADLKRELDTSKWVPWAAVTHRFYLAIPHDLRIDDITIPDRWGVYTIGPRGVTTRRKAPKGTPGPIPVPITIEAYRRASRAEARIRQAGDDDPAALAARLHRELDAAQQQIHTARQAEDRWRHRAEAALDLFATTIDTVHCRCGTRITLRARPFGRHRDVVWEHTTEPGEDTSTYIDGPCGFPRVDYERLAGQLEEATR